MENQNVLFAKDFISKILIIKLNYPLNPFDLVFCDF